MCYDIVSATRAQLKYAKHRRDDPTSIAELEKQLSLVFNSLQPHYHINGFAHPDVLVFTNQMPELPQAFSWGLIPFWVKDLSSGLILRNQTLNARQETLFEKPSFREAAKKRRCLVYIDAFYEHHHSQGKSFPFHISYLNQDTMVLGGIWEEWVNKENGEIFKTVSLVTTKGNDLMSTIHNNPKMDESRMPVIIPKEKQDQWLFANTKEQVQELMQPLEDGVLTAHTVQRIRGKNSIPDIPEAENKFEYPELEGFSFN